MLRKIYWTVAILALITGLTITLYFTLKPRPIPKIRMSQFESTNVLVNSVLLRLREEIKAAPVLIFGINTTYQEPSFNQVLADFVSHTSAQPELKYDILIKDSSLTGLNVAADTVDIQENQMQIFRVLKGYLSQKKRVLIITPMTYSSQLIKKSFSNSLKGENIQPLSFSLTDFPRKREDEKSALPVCVTNVSDEEGTGFLGCMILQQARLNYRKKMPSGSLSGFVDQVGMTDYLLFLTSEL